MPNCLTEFKTKLDLIVYLALLEKVHSVFSYYHFSKNLSGHLERVVSHISWWTWEKRTPWACVGWHSWASRTMPSYWVSCQPQCWNLQLVNLWSTLLAWSVLCDGPSLAVSSAAWKQRYFALSDKPLAILFIMLYAQVYLMGCRLPWCEKACEMTSSQSPQGS